MATVYIGIGSNVDAINNMLACAEMLRADYPDITFSAVYKTAARDAEDQADFLNAVAMLETDETPEEIYETLAAIESELGKDPPYDKGPRTIDLDILLCGGAQYQIRNTKYNIQIPHPRMTERRFVLEPLSELDSSWEDALQKTLDQACEKTDIVL